MDNRATGDEGEAGECRIPLNAVMLNARTLPGRRNGSERLSRQRATAWRRAEDVARRHYAEVPSYGGEQQYQQVRMEWRSRFWFARRYSKCHKCYGRQRR